MSQEGWSSYDEMVRSSPHLWHVHRDDRGTFALSTSVKAPTREEVIQGYLIPLQRLDRDADGKWVQVDYCWTRQEAIRKAEMLGYTNEAQEKAA